MGTNRHLDVAQLINETARADREPVGVRHVCLACRIGLNAISVGVYLAGTAQPLEVVGAAGDEFAELQVMVGEGPVSESLRQNRPVFAADLADDWNARRWPVFASAAIAAGVAAVFVIPLALGGITLGALEICRDVDGVLSPDELADALLFADAATTLLLHRAATSTVPDSGDLSRTEPERRWGVVHQATGMVSVQLGADLGEAFLRLRAHSYLTGRRLSDVATDVVARTLRFAPDTNHEK
ncbi:GAF and ANTAR domain-containing protein [Lentzea tibetensis]|uniref:GAF and ANTAR domain-containing protein n=1 Tax=Lentzea tibetensis TaxID=2591470 RepID=A0A563EKK1_9PSEU|nr:GAF and ANTAR domain-containing protein [Lentzea tibetensis]TWP47552.1 GAF and ANTAR domain-containing protein [Lentzea tibetensis]